MKKRTEKYILVGALIAIILVAGYFGFVQNSFIVDAYKLSCTPDTANNIINCGSVTSTSTGGADAGGTYTVYAINGYPPKDWSQVLINIWSQSNATAKAFFSTATPCGYSATDYQIYNVNPKADGYASIATHRYVDHQPGCEYEVYQFQFGSLASVFPNQLMIIEGYTTQNRGTTQNPFTTYAICQISNTHPCIVRIPETVNTDSTVYFTSYTIYPKVGGYTDDGSICIKDGIEKCVGNELFVCNNFQLNNRSLVDGKCGYTKPSPPTQTTVPIGSDNSTSTTTCGLLCSIGVTAPTTTDTGTTTTTTTTTTNSSNPPAQTSGTTTTTTTQQTQGANYLAILAIIAGIMFATAIILIIRRRK